MLTNHDIKKNIPFCNNPAELLTWKHAFCEEFCNWSLSLENNNGIWKTVFLSIYPKITKVFCSHRCVACEVRVNLNYSTELHFTIFYWFKSPTWHRKSNRACAKITGKPGKQQTWRLILRWRKCTRLSRKSGYFQHWLEYSSAFEVLEAREKLNIVPSSWETFENLRKCWPSLHESKLRLNTCCPVSWTLFMLDKFRYRKLIEPKTTWANQEHASCLLQGIISWTNGIKRKLKKHAKQGTVRMFKWTFNVTTRNVTVRNKTFIKCSYICRIC